NKGKLLRSLAIGGAIQALMLASWLPGSIVVRSGHLSGRMEHLLAYMLATLLVAACLPRRLWPPAVTGLCGLAALLEAGQVFVPGRMASVLDLAGSLAGVAVDVALIATAGVVVRWIGALLPISARGPLSTGAGVR